jgi:sphinganine-1-phosphate aldolase
MNDLKDLLRKVYVNYLHYNNYNISKIEWVKLYGYYNIIVFAYKILLNSRKHIRNTIKMLPYVKTKINEERQKIIMNIHTKFDEQLENIEPQVLPHIGFNSDKLVGLFEAMVSKGDIKYRDGRVSGATYSNNKDLDTTLAKIFPYFNKSNPLHTNLYPAVRKMEQECIAIMIKLFNGSNGSNEACCGSFTSGGTESILLACKTYRDRALAEKNIREPEIIVSSTVHCAFNKACKYFNIKMVMIKCNENGYYDTYKLEEAINPNTILIVGSTPSYNLGIIDQCDKLNAIALKHSVPLHLDACIGSFLINFSYVKYDFRLEGVTSISADFHKYGQSPKGASSIMYRNKELMKYQYFIDETWSGGIYASTAFAGSRCGNIVALTWATLMYHGNLGYLANYNNIMALKSYFINKIHKISELYIYGNPVLSIIAVNSNELNINTIAEDLKKKSWEVNVIQNPRGFHFCITSYHSKEVLDNFFYDLTNIINNLKKTNKGNEKYSPCIYGTMEKINDSDIMNDVITDYLHVVNGAL